MTNSVGEPIRILHVDDDPEFAAMTARFLEREDDRFTVETTTGASEGVERLADGDFDCVISDYEMPDVDGIEFLEAIREEYPDLPLILFTGEGSEKIAGEAIEAGVDSYQRKGSCSDRYVVLADRIREHVRQYRERARVVRLEEEHELIAKTATDVFWTVDVATGDQTLSDGIQQFGYDPEGIDPDLDWWYERLHPDDRDQIRTSDEARFAREEAAFDEIADDRGWFSNEYRWQRADGTYADCRERGVVLFDGEEPVKMVGTITDITERKERERRLRRSEQRYRQLLETSPGPIFIYGVDGELVYSNEAAVEFLETSDRDELLGTTVGDFTHPESEATVERRRRRLIEDREPVPPTEETLIDSDGEVKHAIVASAPVTYEGDPAIQTVATDITEQKEYERKLERQNERLDEFASIVSHDLRNPLNVAELRLELAQTEYNSEHLDAVARAHGRMATLVEDLLALAREGDTVSETEPLDLGDISERCWRNIQTAAATLVTETDRAVRADSTRLQQLLENLFRNAIEHGGREVVITVGALTDRPGFFVADDGPGIPEDDRELVFESGYSTSEDGTGYGLSIVRAIVESHDWDIRLTNSEDGGARFEITTAETDP